MKRLGITAAGCWLLVAGCSPAPDTLEKPARSALWVPAGAEVAFADLGRLERAGVGELFVEAARLTWEGRMPRLEELPFFTLPRRTGVTLVVVGEAPAAESEPDEAAAALAAALERLGPRAEAAGLVPLGFHLDLVAAGSLAGYGALLAALQEHLDSSYYLSVSLPREWLADPEVEEVTRAVDFFVPLVYGQRPGEVDDEDAWDLEEMAASLERSEELGRDYLAGVVTVGRLAHLAAGGEVVAETTRAGLGELVRHPALELVHGFTLEGVDRQIYRFEARTGAKVGEWTLPAGDQLRSVGLTSHHLEELERRLAALPAEHRLGTLYYRLAAPGEGFSLSLENLLAALAPEPATAAPHLELLAAGRGRLKVRLENASEEPTDVALVGTNYVELRLPEGSFGSVQPGAFTRWELLAPGPRGDLVRTFRAAPVLRLYLPYLGPREAVESGPIELRGGGEPTVGGTFLVPGGREVEVRPAVSAPPAPEG